MNTATYLAVHPDAIWNVGILLGLLYSISTEVCSWSLADSWSGLEWNCSCAGSCVLSVGLKNLFVSKAHGE